MLETSSAETRAGANGADLHEPMPAFLRRLRTGEHGLSEREASRRLQANGPNQLPAPARESALVALLAQLRHPLALVLWAAAGLSVVAGTPALALAIVLVIVINAVFSFHQERQAQQAVAALAKLLPPAATVIRDGERRALPAIELVVGDLIVVEEGDGISADARLLDGAVDLDMSSLTGESSTVARTAGARSTQHSWLAAPDLLFSGTLCTGGAARAVVFATGAQTELGRIAALSQRQKREPSPLERQVRNVAWLIAAVGTVVGLGFMPVGVAAGLSVHDAFLFAIGLLVANVPEGLLPTITLALAAGVRALARRGSIVKRLSGVEVLGSTTVICTDKTGTLTENKMRAAEVGTPAGWRTTDFDRDATKLELLGETLAACSVAERTPDGVRAADPTEQALYELAVTLGAPGDPDCRDRQRLKLFRFSSAKRLMSAVQASPAGAISLAVKGAPETILARCGSVESAGRVVRLDTTTRDEVTAAVDAMTSDGLRVLAVARRPLEHIPEDREAAECDLRLVGIVGLLDPPRAEVAAAVEACHVAGIRILVVTGDNGATAAHVAQQVGIGADGLVVVGGDELDSMPETELDRLLRSTDEIVFARSSPEAKLRIADALRAQGQIVAMTGDGVNDAPALHRADIGVAMGRGGTDVAREAATMVLADDNFATLAVAVEEGRRVYDNVRKFILYIFAHATPEVVPFLVFALAGGRIPLPLTVMQILAIDLGTETLPALALGREPAEPGIMQRPPRAAGQPIVDRSLLLRAWAFLGGISAVLVVGAFFFTLWQGGWHAGAATGAGSHLHRVYVQATTATFVAIVACQIGTAFAARTDRASLRAIGVLSNPLLLCGIAFEVAFTALLVALPGVQSVFGTAVPPLSSLLFIAPFPLIVWAADEWRRMTLRKSRQPVRA